MLSKKREIEGKVVSDKMQKTVVVEVRSQVKHPRFKKYYSVRKKYKAHDEKNDCKVGDVVVITESRPLSREKRWSVVKILERAVLA